MPINDELTDLKFLRGQIKGKLTRTQHYFESLDLSKIDDIYNQLRIRLQKIEPIFDEFFNIQTRIERIDSAELESNNREEFENSYFQLVAQITDTINIHANKSTSSITNVTSSVQGPQVKLPILKLPTFRGQYTQWLEFRDAFTSLIHNNQALSDIEKFYYLRSSLEGDASKIIESIEASAGNYQISWQLLLDRFENKRLIIHNHVKAIFEQGVLMKECHNDLRNLIDNVNKHLRSLKTLGEPIDKWDTLIIYLITSKLDPVTLREWESYKLPQQLSIYDDINNFLKNRCELLEKLQVNKKDKFEKTCKFSSFKVKNNQSTTQANAIVNTTLFSCYFCKRAHTIYMCNSFLELNPSDRCSEAKKLKLCLNCLKPNHRADVCKVSKCRKCGKAHNTLLHFDSNISEQNSTQVEDNAQLSQSNSSIVSQVGSAIINTNNVPQILLSTAVVQVSCEKGKYDVRVLLDSGAQNSLVSQELCEKLNLHLTKTNFSISGVGQVQTSVKFLTNIHIFSKINSYNQSISCLVLPRITENLPSLSFNTDFLNIPSNLKNQLADPTFNIASQVDMLIGADVFWNLVCVGQVKLENTGFSLQKTRLGWLVAGSLNMLKWQRVTSINCSQTECKSLDDTIQKFWVIEEVASKVNPKSSLNNSDNFCEVHFLENYKLDEQGRFTVSIPFKDNLQQLGNSRNFALQRFYSLERKLQRDTELYSEYKRVMAEYITMGHMTEIVDCQGDQEANYYLPHHAVVKNTSLTTKVRVVFDASMKTDNGVSLNDVQYSGPVIQNDLFSIIVRFRKHQYVMTSDIAKMYRMIKVQETQRCFQRIFWRSEPSDDVKCYEMNRVVFGTASAPFLAIRCLYQLGVNCEKTHPRTSDIIKNDFYVDDCLTGCDDETILLQLQYELSEILSSGGFELRKWLSNRQKLTKKFQIHDNIESSILNIGENEANKTLGILWNSNQDTIQYFIADFNNEKTVTKRTILSVISQIFDPLGLLGPIIIIAKLFIRTLWQEKIGWDVSLPQSLHTHWIRFRDSLECINSIKIPRHVVTAHSVTIECHGFCDSSEKAYGACIYVRCQDNRGKFTSRLLCAKSRVTPVKQVRVPRLELCSALLLAQLSNRVIDSIKIKFDKTYLYSDSTITLAWIRGCPSRWKTFVANRVTEIQNLTNIDDWYHVRSEHNPADLISRGMSTSDLIESDLWWSGPEWLKCNKLQCSKNKYDSIDETLLEQREQQQMIHHSITEPVFDIFDKFSSLTKLQRVVSYCLRFINNSRKSNECRLSGNLSVSELQRALIVLIRLSQKDAFSQEFFNLAKKKSLHKRSHLLSLNPFMDNESLLRVGGRIQRSMEEYDKKHPIILSPKHKLTKLIFIHEHKRLLHCGPTMLLHSIRERFWPLSGRNIARQTVHKCITCFRVSPKTDQYLMGNLPENRVNQYLPFHNSGVDYAGPFLVKDRSTRGAKLTKAYVCLFICMATKAIHLECVSNLTTECFLDALKRFIGRRGMPSNLYSDNAKNFVGASAELSRFFDSNSDIIINHLAVDNIMWHFIPARSPNFGGIWEAGIKSAKFHLKRVLGNAHLTFESFYTVLVQIESILNSRPLCPLSSLPDQLTPLTPAHFLVGKSLTAIPEPSLTHIPENRLNQYQRLQSIVQNFWARWHREYLTELQTRVRWKENAPNFIKEGAIVLVKEDNTPPLQWHMGRVLQLYPGEDGVVRVVSLKVNGSIVKRAVNKLCIFPLPLCPLSSLPDQLTPLTPAHFLVGKSLTAIPEPSLTHIPENRLNQYQRLQSIVQNFWARWHREYLTELQTRVRWKENAPNFIKEGAIVLVKEDNTPPLQWHMGRVLQLYPGEDGVVRVVSLKVNGSIVKRAVNKLCIFPHENDEAE